MLGNIDVENSAFYEFKCSFDVNEINIDKIAISNKVLYGKKGFRYFSRYKDDDKVKPLCSCYIKCFDETIADK